MDYSVIITSFSWSFVAEVSDHHIKSLPIYFFENFCMEAFAKSKTEGGEKNETLCKKKRAGKRSANVRD